VALISLSASVFLLLVLLWTDARASEIRGVEHPATQAQAPVQVASLRTAGNDVEYRIPDSLLPDSSSSSASSNRPGGNWIDKPGNNLKLGAAILGGVSVASFIIGGVFMGMSRSAADEQHHCGSGIESIGCGWAGLGQGIVGISMLSAGAVTGLASLGMLIAGEVKANNAADEAQKRIEMSPYINPIIEKNPSASSGLSFEGAVAGIKGRF
jgi:hypothetical protein